MKQLVFMNRYNPQINTRTDLVQKYVKIFENKQSYFGN